MPFLDDLTLVLDLLILVAVSVFYTGALVWFEMSREDGSRARSHLRQGAVLMGLLGGALAIIAAWGELTWPFGASGSLASYNVFFFDPLAMLSILLIGFALASNLRLPTSPVGILGVVVGGGVMYYGYRAYTLSLTKAPLETLLMYLAFGAVAILSYPATLFVDLYVNGPAQPEVSPLPTDPKPTYSLLWSAIVALFLVVVILAGAAALAYGYSTVWSHLGHPP